MIADGYSDSEVVAVLSRFVSQDIDVTVLQELHYSTEELGRIVREAASATGIQFRRYTATLSVTQLRAILDAFLAGIERPAG